MQISERWLREWVDPSANTRRLAQRLTMAGLEVGSIESAAPGFRGVLVAEVRRVEAHPDADHLRVCRVWDGEREHQVVCGAPNVRVGLLSAYAKSGARLPDGTVIERATLRGIESAGMLCSGAELGIGDGDGILELDGDCRVGEDLRKALALDDALLDIELTPNRGDCLSVRGVAREVGVCFGAAVTAPDCGAVAAAVADTFPVRIDAPSACPRYLGRVIRGIDAGKVTPLWMRERLRRSGLRAIDPVVDVTNYVMLELGQPLHAFDLAVLAGQITVRFARAGETLHLLDGREVALDSATLLICDENGPIAMAGVMGGERSGIGPATRDVFLECAFFAPAAIAGTARRYGMQTDASQRFERGVDHSLQHAAVERATALLLAIVGGRPGPVIDTSSGAHLPASGTVELRRARLDRYVGARLAPKRVTEAFERLGFAPTYQGRGRTAKWTVNVPSHRFDIEREVDLIEEVCRIHGYDRIPTRLPETPLALGRPKLTETPRTRLRQLLADLGYQEAITYSFIDPLFADLLTPGAPTVSLTNPMSTDMSVMRASLWPGLLKALIANASRQQSRIRLFEIGACFAGSAVEQQVMRVGGVVTGARLPEGWANDAAPADFFDVKGDVERLLELSGHTDVRYQPAADSILHPGQAATVWSGDRCLGRLGRLHPEIEHRLDLKGPVFTFELDAEPLLARRPATFLAYSRYPSVRRDLALLLDRGVPAAAIRDCLEAALGELLTDFRVFDVYLGEGIDSAKKSIAVGLTLQAPSRTLTDTEINDLMDTAVNALETDLGARRR
jgi:phenylalanyl-tRNA synthetase beta chain